MTRECIEDMREVVLPFVKKRLLEINYEGLGESDAKEFEKEFNEILNLAIKALEQEPFLNKPCVSSGVCEHDKNKALDKIRAEIEEIAKPNKFGGRANGKSIRYGLCMALEIIDKYREETEE